MRIDEIKLTTELKRRDMTQKQLSELANISRGTVNGIAAGRKCSEAVAKKC